MILKNLNCMWMRLGMGLGTLYTMGTLSLSCPPKPNICFILLFHKWFFFFFRNVILLKINEWWMQVTKRFLLIQPLKPLDITNKMFSVLRTALLQKKCFDWMSTIFQILSQGPWCFYKPISDDRNLDNLFVHFSISFNKTEHLWRFKLRDHWYL